MSTTAYSLNDFATRAIDLLREVPGVAVQVYAEPRLEKLSQTVFDLIFRKHWFPSHCEWQTVTLDGTTGKPTSNLTVDSFHDIKVLYPQNSDRPLPLLPHTMNPDNIAGTSARFVAPLRQPESGGTTKLFRILPITCTDSITFYARYHPGDQSDTPNNAVFYIDKEIIALGVTYISLEQDGTNPGATELYQNMFNDALKTYDHAYDSPGIPLGNINETYPTQWYSE